MMLITPDFDQRLKQLYTLFHGLNRSETSRHEAPDPLTHMGKLAVDQTYLSKGLGVASFKDAINRTEKIAHQVRIKALIVHT